MASTRQKGKIPHSEWPTILARYGKGETIAQIGRDYGCTPPAIRYIVKRSGMLARGERTGGAAAPSQQQARSDAVAVRLQPATPVATVPSQRADHVLAPELRQRVSGDVACFLVALDQAVLEGTHDSVANLQEATDRLMRSTARTRLELERLLSRHETTGAREKGRRNSGSSLRGA